MATVVYAPTRVCARERCVVIVFRVAEITYNHVRLHYEKHVVVDSGLNPEKQRVAIVATSSRVMAWLILLSSIAVADNLDFSEYKTAN